MVQLYVVSTRWGTVQVVPLSSASLLVLTKDNSISILKRFYLGLNIERIKKPRLIQYSKKQNLKTTPWPVSHFKFSLSFRRYHGIIELKKGYYENIIRRR
ncbi:hypothetical protein IJ114_00800 [Candidatus Saccharibacteria bacterium]|nr:hypothetical protein [Candidatus Saccharibacteria bacterium]